MLQFVLSFLPLLAIIAAVFTTAYRVRHAGVNTLRLLEELGLCVENSPAQAAFFMFSFAAAIAAVLVCTFAHVSTRFILSLDILFFFSSLLLILYHRFKTFASASL
jgi:hypothetical protein